MSRIFFAVAAVAFAPWFAFAVLAQGQPNPVPIHSDHRYDIGGLAIIARGARVKVWMQSGVIHEGELVKSDEAVTALIVSGTVVSARTFSIEAVERGE